MALIAVVGGAGAGCGHAAAHLNHAALRATGRATIAAFNSPPPRFRGVTSGEWVLAGLGLIGAVIKEESLHAESVRVAREGIQDPAIAIASELVEALAPGFSLKVAPSKPIRLRLPATSPADPPGGFKPPHELYGDQPTIEWSDSPAGVARINRDVDLVLHVQTLAWGFEPVRLDHYGITYRAALRLIDTRSVAVLSEGVCIWSPMDSPDAPRRGALMRNHAALLRQHLRAVEKFCIDDYRTRILALPRR